MAATRAWRGLPAISPLAAPPWGGQGTLAQPTLAALTAGGGLGRGRGRRRTALNLFACPLRPAVSQHAPVQASGLKTPTVASTAWLAPNASVVGDVTVGDHSSLWYNCTVRGACGAADPTAAAPSLARTTNHHAPRQHACASPGPRPGQPPPCHPTPLPRGLQAMAPP